MEIWINPSMLLFAYAEKAFYRLDLIFIKPMVSRMKLGNWFSRWTGLLYEVQNAFIYYQRKISKVIAIHWGVKQGCPFSPIFFLTSVWKLD